MQDGGVDLKMIRAENAGVYPEEKEGKLVETSLALPMFLFSARHIVKAHVDLAIEPEAPASDSTLESFIVTQQHSR